jgi:hypothetical protein
MKKVFFVAVIFVLASCSKPGAGDFTINLFGACCNFPERVDSSIYIKADVFAGNGLIVPLNYAGYNTRLQRTSSLNHADSNLVIFSGGDSTVGLEFSLINVVRTGTYRFGETPGDSISIRAKCRFNGIDYLNDSTLMSGSITIDMLTANRIHAIFSVPCIHNGYTVDVKNGSFEAGF